MKTAVVDVGGGMRGIYAAGVLDYCMDHQITFDLGIGVSAGSANISSFIAGQRGRNYPFYTDYPHRKEYMGLHELVHDHSYLNLGYVYGTLSNAGGENPLDFSAMLANPMDFLAVATNAETGEAVYLTKADMHQDDYSVLMASSAIPFVCRPQRVRGIDCYDGALSDTVPIQKAFEAGCEKVVLLLTKPLGVLRTSKNDIRLARLIQKKYPISAQQLRDRAQRYNAGVALAKQYAQEGRLCIIAPDDTCGVDTLTKDREASRRLYEKGYADGAKIPAFLHGGTPE